MIMVTEADRRRVVPVWVTLNTESHRKAPESTKRHRKPQAQKGTERRHRKAFHRNPPKGSTEIHRKAPIETRLCIFYGYFIEHNFLES